MAQRQLITTSRYHKLRLISMEICDEWRTDGIVFDSECSGISIVLKMICWRGVALHCNIYCAIMNPLPLVIVAFNNKFTEVIEIGVGQKVSDEIYGGIRVYLLQFRAYRNICTHTIMKELSQSSRKCNNSRAVHSRVAKIQRDVRWNKFWNCRPRVEKEDGGLELLELGVWNEGQLVGLLGDTFLSKYPVTKLWRSSGLRWKVPFVCVCYIWAQNSIWNPIVCSQIPDLPVHCVFHGRNFRNEMKN